MPSLRRTLRASKGSKEIIDPQENVCLPPYECGPRGRRLEPSSLDTRLAFTDNINRALVEDPIPLSDGLIDVPEGDPPQTGEGSFVVDGGLIFEAVTDEIDENDNPLILESKVECEADQKDYCYGDDYKSGAHTMCKFCVSSQLWLHLLGKKSLFR